MRTTTTTATWSRPGTALLLALLGFSAPPADAGAQLPLRAVEPAMERAERALTRAHLDAARHGMALVGPALAQVRPALARVGPELAQARAVMEAEGREVGAALRLSSATVMPEGWLQEDPGADLYREAREALNDGRWERAAGLMSDLREEHPESGYVPDSYYWEAFALYRLGGRGALREATELLAVQADEHPDAGTREDAAALRVRIEGERARRGDSEAAASIARQAQEPCGEDQELRLAALSALMNMHADRARPILEEVLESRDRCSVELRRQAVFLVAQTLDDDAVDILIDLAHRDPDPDAEVREQAVFWLSQVRSEEALDALSAILAETSDPELQEQAVYAISQHDSPRAAALLRDFAERSDADPEVRGNAIFWIGESGGSDGAAYLRELYPGIDDQELKDQIIFALAESGDAASAAWLLDRVRDPSEDVEIRNQALFWAGESNALGVSDLQELYDSFQEPEMKEQLIFVAAEFGSSEAVDFLMQVAREEDDPDLRENAIFWLGQSEDPRVPEFLLGLIRG